MFFIYIPGLLERAKWSSQLDEGSSGAALPIVTGFVLVALSPGIKTYAFLSLVRLSGRFSGELLSEYGKMDVSWELPIGVT